MAWNETFQDNNFIDSLNDVSHQLNRYLTMFIFLFGSIGNILNCFVLSQRTFRTNPCAFLFYQSSIINLISLTFGLVTRILSGWDIDPTATNGWLCKLRVFIVFSSRNLGIWLIMLATFDRWLVSSQSLSRRQASTLKNAKKGVLISSILTIIFYSHLLFCYESDITEAPMKCYGKNIVCLFINDLTYIIMTISIPIIAMIIFGLLTISNLKSIHNRIQPAATRTMTNGQIRRAKRTDRHLLRMLILQVICLIVFCIPQATEKVYFTIYRLSNSNLQLRIHIFIYNIVNTFAFMASGIPFYIYTLASKSVFQKTFFKLLKEMFNHT